MNYFRFTVIIFSSMLLVNSCFGKCIKGTCLNGKGTYQFNNGNKYIGEWKNYQLNGKGIFIYKSGKFKGCKYTGEFKKNKIHGYGIFISQMEMYIKDILQTIKCTDMVPLSIPMENIRGSVFRKLDE